MSRIYADSVFEAIPMIRKVLSREATAELYVTPERRGYWAQLKPAAKPPCDMNRAELAAELKRRSNPQVKDITVTPWGFFMYRGYDKIRKSSAF